MNTELKSIVYFILWWYNYGNKPYDLYLNSRICLEHDRLLFQVPNLSTWDRNSKEKAEGYEIL